MMNENAGQFRSAALGGFHRQDVLDYLERIARENQEEKDAMLAEKSGLESTLSQEEEARAQAEHDLSQAEQREKALLEEHGALEKEIVQLKDRLAQREEEIVRLKEENRGLRETVDRLEPDAASWHRIKNTAGDIEVAAHERAQITIQEARAQAAEIHAEGIRWVLNIQSCCDMLQQDLRTAISAAEKELDAARAAFSLAETDMEGFQQALSTLVTESGAENK